LLVEEGGFDLLLQNEIFVHLISKYAIISQLSTTFASHIPVFLNPIFQKKSLDEQPETDLKKRNNNSNSNNSESKTIEMRRLLFTQQLEAVLSVLAVPAFGWSFSVGTKLPGGRLNTSPDDTHSNDE